jgi:hypothetical protein
MAKLKLRFTAKIDGREAGVVAAINSAPSTCQRCLGHEPVSPFAGRLMDILFVRR